MTTHEINAFVARLLLREVTGTELAALSTEDLVAINLYLLEQRMANSESRVLRTLSDAALSRTALRA